MNKPKQLERLLSIPEEEWHSVLEGLTNFIGKRLKGRITNTTPS